MASSANTPIAGSLIDESARRQFEAAWRAGRAERIESYLPEPSSPAYLPTLLELAMIELELAWKKQAETGTLATSQAKTPPSVEDYLRRFPGLQAPAYLAELVGQEYRARQIFGDRPAREEFERRFPGVLAQETEVSTFAGRRHDATRSVRFPEIPGYEIIEVLGRGGMGVVFKARQRNLNRLVALKMILAGAQAEQGELERFQREAEAVAHLHHPNIVHIHEIGIKDGQPFFSLEFIEGGSLAQCLERKPQPPRSAATLVATLARAMDHVHQRGIVHRDLKPANILLAPNDALAKAPSASADPQTSSLVGCLAKISDFGLAKRLEGAAAHTHTGAILGTPSYMAPEQAAGRTKDIGPATDIYALGAILYEMLTGRPPFQASTPFETVMQVVKDEPTPLRRLQPGIDRDLETICQKAMAKEPGKRYASALALANDLERYLADESILARREGPAARLWRKVKRRPLVYLGSLMGVVVLGVAGGIFLHGRESEERAQLDRQISALQTNLAKELDLDEFDQHHLERMDGLMEQLADLDSDLAAGARARAVHRHQSYLERQIKLPRLTPADRERVEQSLKLFTVRDPRTGKSLALAFKQRLRDWEPVFDLQAPFAELDKVFAGPLIVKQPKVIVAYPSDDKDKKQREPARILSKVACGGNVRMETMIDGFGDNVSEVGLLLNVGQTHASWVRSLVFSPDGRWLASAGDDATVLVWEIATGQVKWQFRGAAGIAGVAFHPGGATLASAVSKQVRLWNLNTGKLEREWEASPQQVLSLTYSPDGATLATAGADMTVKLWNTRDYSLRDTLAEHPGPVGIVLMPDNLTLVAVTTGLKRTVRQWDMTKKTLRDFSISFRFDDNIVTVSPDGRLVMGSTWASSIQAFEVPTGQNKMSFDVPYANMTISPTGKYLAAGCCHLNGKPMPLIIYDVTTGRRLAVLTAHGRDIYRIAFSADGATLASASGDGSIRLWNVPDFTLKRVLGGTSYSFLLSANETAREGAADSFQLGRGQPAYMRILVEGQEQRRKEIQLPAGASSLLLRATRENNTLSFQVNDLPPVTFDDLFALPSLTLGVFALQTNGETQLRQVSAFRQAAPAERSPLEQGDLLVASGKFREALDFYQQQALATAGEVIGREARCKAGLCLMNLGRHKEANELFEQVFGQAQQDRWGQFAACQMLMHRLTENKFDDPETEHLFEVLQPRSQQVAAVVPLATANRILGSYGISPFDYFFFKPSHLARLKRGVYAEQLFDRPANVSLKVKVQLLHGYGLLERDQEALAYARKLFAEVKEAAAGKADPPHMLGLALAECCWVLRRHDDPRKLLVELESLIAPHGSPPRCEFARPVWLEKARTLALINDKARAEQTLAEFLNFRLPANERDYGTYAGACLLMGFLCDDKGQREQAVKFWKDGTVRSWSAKLPGLSGYLSSITDTLSLHNQLILSSLANDLSDADASSMVSRITQGAHAGSPLQWALKRFPIPASVMRDLYLSPRGRSMARKIAFRDLPFGDYIRGTVHLAFYEYARQQGMPTSPLSPEQDASVWKFAQDTHSLYASGKLDEFKMLQFGLAWQQGNTGAFGWGGFAAKLEGDIKANFAYVLGQRMRRLNKAKEAAFLFRQAVAAAPAGTALRRLAETEAEKLDKNR